MLLLTLAGLALARFPGKPLAAWRGWAWVLGAVWGLYGLLRMAGLLPSV